MRFIMSKNPKEFAEKVTQWMSMNDEMYQKGELSYELLIYQNNRLLELLKTFGGGSKYQEDESIQKFIDKYYEFAKKH